jgi:dolichol-phosphate mannosyltransferase
MTSRPVPEISVVIPVYLAEDCLEELYARLKAALETVSPDFEIILVEDRGPDRSWPMIQALAARDARVTGLRLSRNFGQHYAITAGLDRCRGRWVVVMDCDLQDRPEEIPRLHAKAREGYDIVLALWTNRRDPFLRMAISALFYRVFSYLTDVKFDSRTRNFRIMSRKVVVALRSLREQLRFFPALVEWTGFQTGSIDVPHDPRTRGKSAYSVSKLLKLGLDTIVAYSDKPLRLAIRMGFAIAGLALLAGAAFAIKAIVFGTPVSGWTSMIVSLYFLSGIIISILGLNGMYLGKAFDEAKKRPLYLIAERTDADSESDSA